METIYNGRSVVQKRKIKEKEADRYGFGRIKKDKMKNDITRLSFGAEKGSHSEDEEDPFITSFCNHSNFSQSQKTQQSDSLASSFSQRTSMASKSNTTLKEDRLKLNPGNIKQYKSKRGNDRKNK